MQQLTAANERLREAMDGCKDGMIEGYPDLEIANIDEFMGDLVESTESLTVNVDNAVEIMGRISEVKEEDALDPELEGLTEPQKDCNARQSPEIGNDEETRSTRLPPPPSRTQDLQARKMGNRFAGSYWKDAEKQRWQAPQQQLVLLHVR